VRPKPAHPPAEVQPAPAQQGAAAEGSQSVNPQSARAPAQPEPKLSSASTNTETANTGDQSGVVQRVMPQVFPSARRTIQGKIKVRVKVEVDAAGNVAKATLESAGPSKYFSRVALEAARAWKFSPVPAGESGAREWKLQFAFSQAKTEVSAVRTKH
jgi:TonB family protein